jgi:hypothetical protein
MVRLNNRFYTFKAFQNSQNSKTTEIHSLNKTQKNVIILKLHVESAFGPRTHRRMMSSLHLPVDWDTYKLITCSKNQTQMPKD